MLLVRLVFTFEGRVAASTHWHTVAAVAPEVFVVARVVGWRGGGRATKMKPEFPLPTSNSFPDTTHIIKQSIDTRDVMKKFNYYFSFTRASKTYRSSARHSRRNSPSSSRTGVTA